MLKAKIAEMEEKQYTNKEQQLIKIANMFGENAFYEETYEYPVGEKKSYQKLHSFYDALGRMGKDRHRRLPRLSSARWLSPAGVYDARRRCGRG